MRCHNSAGKGPKNIARKRTSILVAPLKFQMESESRQNQIDSREGAMVYCRMYLMDLRKISCNSLCVFTIVSKCVGAL